MRHRVEQLCGGVLRWSHSHRTMHMYAGIDGAMHLAEKSTSAVTAVPCALISTLIIVFWEMMLAYPLGMGLSVIL